MNEFWASFPRFTGFPIDRDKIVAGMVQQAVRKGLAVRDPTLEMLQASAREVIGRPAPLTQAQFEQALDPAHFVAGRRTVGGVAPEATAAVLKQLAGELAEDEAWLLRARRRLADR